MTKIIKMSQKITEELGPHSLHLQGFRLWVHGRQYPDALDYWDANWLLVTVECESIGAEVWLTGPLIHLSELEQWANATERMLMTLEGEANLDCDEPELSVKLAATKLGQILMTVDISPQRRTQQHCFQFDLDQSYLADLIRDCRAILVSYPIRGK
jgi:hypothetical protein